MLIKQYIKELLYIHECVTIPSFGAFLTQSTRAFVNYEVGNFEPPKKIIGFNILLKNNDGVLANHLAKKEKISYEKALKNLERLEDLCNFNCYEKIELAEAIEKFELENNL